MKGVKLIILSIILSLLISCTPGASTNMTDKITSPNNTLPPISGEWKIYKYKQSETSSITEEEAESFIGKSAAFDETVAILVDDSCTNPTYKIKNVAADDYVIYQYKVKPEYIDIQNDKIQVVTVTSGNQFFNEFIKINNNHIISYIDGVFFYLEKSSDNVSKETKDKFAQKLTTESTDNNKGSLNYSGVLLGLKSPRKSPDKGFVYRTLWIPASGNVLGTIYETSDLFVPRKSGFWHLGVKREKENESYRDVLFAYTDNKLLPIKPASSISTRGSTCSKNLNVVNSILFVSNDYVSTECSTFASSGNMPTKSIYQVLPIDNIEKAKAIKIGDILGPGGTHALEDGASQFISANPDGKNKSSYLALNEENFGLARRNGHWIIKGRLNKAEPEDSIPYVDFNIKAIPPQKLVNYDELYIPWSVIKSKVPEAIDAFTSPNKNIAIVISPNSILVYPIENDTISENPIKKIKLKDKETVVMAEWATGKYTDKWEKEFLRNKVTIID